MFLIDLGVANQKERWRFTRENNASVDGEVMTFFRRKDASS